MKIALMHIFRAGLWSGDVRCPTKCVGGGLKLVQNVSHLCVAETRKLANDVRLWKLPEANKDWC